VKYAVSCYYVSGLHLFVYYTLLFTSQILRISLLSGRKFKYIKQAKRKFTHFQNKMKIISKHNQWKMH